MEMRMVSVSAEGLQGDAKKDDEPDREPDVDKNVISFKESTGSVTVYLRVYQCK